MHCEHGGQDSLSRGPVRRADPCLPRPFAARIDDLHLHRILVDAAAVTHSKARRRR